VSVFQSWFTREGSRFRIRALKALRRDHPAELAVIRAHLRPGDIACDIGANKGSFIWWLSRWVGNGRVVAFEPQPELAGYLSSICRVMGLHNVTVEAKAVYSQSGHHDLFVPAGHQPGASLVHRAAEAESFTVLSVPVVALDDYFNENDRVALLKIDVEGAELGVLKGAERILRRHGPLLIFECENRHLAPGTVDEVFSWLEALGYEGSFVCRHRLLPLSEFDARIHQRQGGEWFWKSKDYCNNFVFRKAAGERDAA
jgi:FkbM family methyltransferase